jgi:hypothetical protein
MCSRLKKKVDKLEELNLLLIREVELLSQAFVNSEEDQQSPEFSRTP